MKLYLLIISASLFLYSCQSSFKEEKSLSPVLRTIDVPTKESGEPNLFVAETGEVYISWVEYLSDSTDALLFSKLESNKWSSPQTVASGSDWFVNWADYPSLAAYKNQGQTLAAHWLQKSAKGTSYRERG